jgi:hypothetical protein
MLMGKPAFKSESTDALISQIVNDDPLPHLVEGCGDSVSVHCVDLLTKLLHKNPVERANWYPAHHRLGIATGHTLYVCVYVVVTIQG